MSQMHLDSIPNGSPIMRAEILQVLHSLWSKLNLESHSGYIIARMGSGLKKDDFIRASLGRYSSNS
jgi:hypothetical protein